MQPTTTLISDKDVARIFSWHRTTVWRNVRKGLLPQPIRIGKATRWNLAEIEALIQKLTIEQTAG
jgi:predicted DNA-binding transcriptional regulator AlpA